MADTKAVQPAGCWLCVPTMHAPATPQRRTTEQLIAAAATQRVKDRAAPTRVDVGDEGAKDGQQGHDGEVVACGERQQVVNRPRQTTVM